MTSAPDQPDASALRRGSKVGKFVVVAELGSGGMGVVYCAHDRELDRQVALKVMRGAGDHAEEDRVRMLREGQAMARVVHPNVITVFEVGTEGGTVFLAQELLDGGTLGQWLEEPHSQEEIIEKFVAAGRGLAAAHAAGLVHRDFKPDNVLLGKDGRVRVSDFGLARAVGTFTDVVVMATPRGGGPVVDNDSAVTRSPLNNLTRTGAVMGTPMYMAPEQHEGRRADERSDQFAFCVALYHALHGDWPYEGKTSIALADNVINGVRKAPPPNTKVHPRLRKILQRGLATSAEDRYPSMEALLAELVVPASSSAGKRVAFAIAALVVVAGGGAAAYLALAAKPSPPPVVDAQPQPVVVQQAFDPTLLVRALDRGELDTTGKVFATNTAASAQASAAFVLALGGDLRAAEAKLKTIQIDGGDPIGAAYVDMAAAAIAHARGELPTAAERSERCANQFSDREPVGAAMCLQLQGDAAADMDHSSAARRAYDAGNVIAQKLGRKELSSMFALSVAQLDFDAQQEDVSLDNVTQLRLDARARRAASCEAAAAVLATRILVNKSEHPEALKLIEDLDPMVLEVYRLQAIARIAEGELYGYRKEGDKDGVMGLDKIDDVRDEAAKKQFWGVYLEAKLARVRVLVTLEEEDAEAERKKLIDEATAKGYKRIARLAEVYNPRAEPPPPQ